MITDLSFIRGYDLETPLTSPGNGAPEIVCGSVARVLPDGTLHGDILDPQQSLATIEEYLKKDYTLATANGAFDLANVAQARPDLLPLIFKCIREGKHHDILISEALHGIYYGILGHNPDGTELRSAEGKVTKRYSLYNVTGLTLNRWDAKVHDVFRKSYYLLKGIPIKRWPKVASDYPIDDAKNQLEVAVAQIVGPPGDHVWETVPGLPGQPSEIDLCKYCGEELTFAAASPSCSKAPRGEPHKNQGNLAAQCEAAFAAHLGACHGLRVDGERLDKLEAVVSEKAKIAVKRFQTKGWIRSDESENTIAVKTAVALAYGVTGQCGRCKGTGKVAKVVVEDCRGDKLKGRYQGCTGGRCVCQGSGKIQKISGEITCKNVFDKEALENDTSPKDALLEFGCDGTGLDLSSAPMLPRTDKLGIGTDRDSKMESGDEDLADYGADEFQKCASTYIPYLRKGVRAPLTFIPNVLVATGRYSYEGSPMHQMSRNGGERECIRARGAWCNYPIEMILSSTDYSAGELCCLGQLTYWLFGYSQMRDAINASGDPGILHSELAAEVLGVSLENFLARLKAKDKQAIDFRQASKPENFGKPAAMGPPKIVYTNRKKNAGFTPCEEGPSVNEKGIRGYWGIRFCILIGGARRCGIEKITDWKGNPCVPVCKACVEIEANILSPAYFRRFPEIKDYHKWGKKGIREQTPAPSLAWNADIGRPVIIRERGFRKWDEELPAYLNNGFQGMLGDIIKLAYINLTREAYLGVKDDDSPSPLAGCRFPLVLHDEPLGELIRNSAHLSGLRVADVMIAAGNTIAPDVCWVAKTALAEFWSKSMEPVVDALGNLTVWRPKEKS